MAMKHRVRENRTLINGLANCAFLLWSLVITKVSIWSPIASVSSCCRLLFPLFTQVHWTVGSHCKTLVRLWDKLAQSFLSYFKWLFALFNSERYVLHKKDKSCYWGIFKNSWGSNLVVLRCDYWPGLSKVFYIILIT